MDTFNLTIVSGYLVSLCQSQVTLSYLVITSICLAWLFRKSILRQKAMEQWDSLHASAQTCKAGDAVRSQVFFQRLHKYLSDPSVWISNVYAWVCTLHDTFMFLYVLHVFLSKLLKIQLKGENHFTRIQLTAVQCLQYAHRCAQHVKVIAFHASERFPKCFCQFFARCDWRLDLVRWANKQYRNDESLCILVLPQKPSNLNSDSQSKFSLTDGISTV